MSEPYSVFGQRLRSLRERAKESVLEVSYAIEIDEKTLERIEAGRELPDEDVLMLLISHFDVKDNDAVKLWELAGYGSHMDKETIPNEEQLLKQVMMVIPFDNRVAFSDTAQIDAKPTGVVINFLQATGNPQPQSVSKIGMSVEQAGQLIQQLAAAVKDATTPKQPRALPAPKNIKNKTEKKKSA